MSGQERVQTGSEGLDNILKGGLIKNRLYLLEGSPGTGKTTLALKFLLQGVQNGEKVLYVTLSETSEELIDVSSSHGWSLDGISLFELANAEGLLDPDQEMTLLHPWEVELGETIKKITEQVEAINPARVVFDSLSELRLLSQESLRYRRQILALKTFFAGRNCTVLLLDDMTGSRGESDLQLHSITHGVITLQKLTLEFGSSRRRLEVQKLRGSDFRGGWHDYVIRKGGLDIFPRLVASEHSNHFADELVKSGIVALDSLLQGGPLRGTSILLTGPAGSGKTSLALQYAVASALRGENVALYEFDERQGTLLLRLKKLGFDVESHQNKGTFSVRQIDPAELSPGEFTAVLRNEVEQNNVRMIIIDSLNGYMSAMLQEKQLLLQMHELLSYLNQKGVITFLINPQMGLVGSMQSNLNISYIADTVLLLRFFEAGGSIRKALSVIKNRGGAHENTIREFFIDSEGVHIGEPLTDFRGIFTGNPEYIGPELALFAGTHDS